MADFKAEKLERTLKTKQIFNFHDTAKGINVLSREVFRDRDEIIHYPRGFEGSPKYKTIRKFIIKDLKKDLKSLVGINKSETFGYGFTRTLRPFEKFVDNTYGLTEVIIQKDGPAEFDLANNRLYLNPAALRKLHNVFTLVFDKNKGETKRTLDKALYDVFKKGFKKPKLEYLPNTLATSLGSWSHSLDDFSNADKVAIKELFDKLSLTPDFLSDDWLDKTKELIDSKYIQTALKEFKELTSLTTGGESLEKKWQNFLKKNSWIFSSVFAQPVILHQDEAYVGGKGLDNSNGKLSDFLIKNSLSDNVSFLEIKTHKTRLLEAIPYRGKDVFSAAKDLTGCVSQVLNQRDNFQKEFYSFKAKSGSSIETLSSKCVVLIGLLSDLNKNQKHCFELYRANSRDVEILTFDELETKIESLQKLLST